MRRLVAALLLAPALLLACGSPDAGSAPPPTLTAIPPLSEATATMATVSSPETPLPAPTLTEVPATETVTPDGGDAPQLEPLCDVLISGLMPQVPSVSELAWYADVIVVGTVRAVGGPYFIDRQPQPPIATDYTLAVDTPIRGVVEQTLAVRQYGGTVGDCTQTYEGEPAFAVGDRVLLFLYREPDETAGVSHLHPGFGPEQSVWKVTGDEMAICRAPHLQTAPQPLAEVIQEVVTALEGSPPAGGLANMFLVTLEESPVVFDGTIAE